MDKKQTEALVEAACSARKRSYCPYSSFAVGAALITKDGKIYTGANIESASFTPTVCAERVAFFTALHGGESEFSAIAVVGGISGSEISDFVTPCGVCRQVMAEFCSPDFEIVLFNGKDTQTHTLSELLPFGFGRASIK